MITINTIESLARKRKMISPTIIKETFKGQDAKRALRISQNLARKTIFKRIAKATYTPTLTLRGEALRKKIDYAIQSGSLISVSGKTSDGTEFTNRDMFPELIKSNKAGDLIVLVKDIQGKGFRTFFIKNLKTVKIQNDGKKVVYRKA